MYGRYFKLDLEDLGHVTNAMPEVDSMRLSLWTMNFSNIYLTFRGIPISSHQPSHHGAPKPRNPLQAPQESSQLFSLEEQLHWLYKRCKMRGKYAEDIQYRTYIQKWFGE
jgi:hypothetical protein